MSNDPGNRPTYTPSSEPFYSSFSSAPISSMPHAQPPPPHTDTPARPDPDDGPPARAAEQAVQSHQPGVIEYFSGKSAAEELDRAPGIPYAPSSGYAVNTAPTTVPATRPATPGPTGSTPASVGPTRLGTGTRAQGRRLNPLHVILAIAFASVVLFGPLISSLAEWGLSELEWDDTPDTVRDDQLYAGLCFETLEYAHSNHLQPVACDEPHRFEVVYNHDLGNGTYPGTDDVSETARSICSEHADAAATLLNSSLIGHYALYPSQSGWAAGDHTLTCFISVPGTSLLVGSYTDGTASVG